MNIFDNYAKYYDLLYQDKDYASESEYVNQLIQKYAPGAKSVLEFGCGTGNHAIFLAQAGYFVHGIDQSNEMIGRAKNRFEQMPSDVFDKIKLSHGDIRTIRLEKQFDAVISLFHVMSYQPENEDLNKVFQNAKIHLKSGGIFLFDCWYGPGVLTDRPTIRIKRLQDDKLMITRIAEPVMYVNENRVDVNYQVFIKDKNSGAVEEINECHKMRYLFTPEIKEFFLKAGMNMIGCYEFMTYKQTSYNTWNVVFIGRR